MNESKGEVIYQCSSCFEVIRQDYEEDRTYMLFSKTGFIVAFVDCPICGGKATFKVAMSPLKQVPASFWEAAKWLEEYDKRKGNQ